MVSYIYANAIYVTINESQALKKQNATFKQNLIACQKLE